MCTLHSDTPPAHCGRKHTRAHQRAACEHAPSGQHEYGYGAGGNCRCAAAWVIRGPPYDRVDRLHRVVFTALLSTQNPYTIEQAVDVTLLSRCYERFADHAVSVAHRLEHLVTGGDEP